MTVPDAAAIFDIQRFSVHDGPGIRTLVFFKGCPLRCAWCCNPESQLAAPEPAWLAARCRHCEACVLACPHRAVAAGADGEMVTDRRLCEVCGTCLETCYAGARVILGRLMTVDEVLDVVRRDHVFYRNSGGGVTLGGGEVTVWPEFAAALLRACRAEGLHSAVETCGHAPWPQLRAVAEQADLVLYDLKHADPEEHARQTGLSNALILDNFRRVVTLGVHVQVRVPVVPGFNDDAASLRDIARVVAASDPRVEIHLLPYHRLGEEKYAQLGREYAVPGLRAPADDTLLALAAAVREEGLVCRVGR